MSPNALLGPPQITISPTTTTTSTTTPTTSDEGSESSYSPIYRRSLIMGYTENHSRTYLTTGNPCLDFFFHAVPDTPSSKLTRLVELSWEHNPLLTLKLICNLRGVRGTGKSDKQGFYTAALWLHSKHPKTLALNMTCVSSFGYLKDMPEILFRLLEGSVARKKRAEGHEMLGKVNVDHEAKEKARVLRLQRKNQRSKKALETYNHNIDFRRLHDSVSDVFAELLKRDVEFLNDGDLRKIGFAAKWCPTLDSTYDEVTLLCESIARRVFRKDDYEEYKDLEEAYYAFKVRDRLRKEVLVPLRKALELPEAYMCAKKWNTLPYNRVPSVAMKLYKRLFFQHNNKRFEEYLEKVKSGKATIAAGALLPHEIIASLDDGDGGQVAELQWKRMVDDLAKKGKLNNCMAICDVSGSMSGIPMEVSVALGLLISELSEDPWKGNLITFSEKPEWHTIKGKTLREKTRFIRAMDWGCNTDFQKVFDRILAVAVRERIPQDHMIKRLFVFSDMEFDEASSNNWETDYMAIQRKFSERGYDKVPEIVFWNLRHSNATPVPSTQPGVALVSGFSKNLMTVFLEEGGILNPEAVMLAAIARPEYDQLVVYD